MDSKRFDIVRFHLRDGLHFVSIDCVDLETTEMRIAEGKMHVA
jgi:hypothetical protein